MQTSAGKMQKTPAAVSTHTQAQVVTSDLCARGANFAAVNPLPDRCGFVFSYAYCFYFFGYRQTPARAGARTMPA